MSMRRNAREPAGMTSAHTRSARLKLTKPGGGDMHIYHIKYP
jgi:hypothetical protein